MVVFASPNFSDSVTSDGSQFREKVAKCASPTPVKFINRIPELDELFGLIKALPEGKKNILTILDDFNYQCFSSNIVHDIFTRLASHSGIGIIVTGQNYFFKEKYYGHIWRVSLKNQTIFLTFSYKCLKFFFQNCNFLTIWRCVSDKLVLRNISMKLFPRDLNFLEKCFDIAVKETGPRCCLTFNYQIDNGLNHRFPVCTRFVSENLSEKPIYFASESKQ